MKKGFTLAEVLITLGIIGVIAAITIPGLIKNYKRHQLEVGFKKAYSQIQQNIKLIHSEDDSSIYATYLDPTFHNINNEKLKKIFFNHIKGGYIKETQNAKPYYTSLKGSTQVVHYCPISCCSNPTNHGYISNEGIMYNVCSRENNIFISFDVNGNDDGPNKWGIDLFSFILYENDVIMPGLGLGYYNYSGCSNYRKQNSTNANDGLGCAYWALKDKEYFKKIDW